MVYGNLSDWRQGKNKANLPDVKMSLKSCTTRDYGDFSALGLRKNKANIPAFGRKHEALSTKS
jgi:hypothetical protein